MRSMTMSWHLTQHGAVAVRDRLDRQVARVATEGEYRVVRSWPFWRVEKRWHEETERARRALAWYRSEH